MLTPVNTLALRFGQITRLIDKTGRYDDDYRQLAQLYVMSETDGDNKQDGYCPHCIMNGDQKFEDFGMFPLALVEPADDQFVYTVSNFNGNHRDQYEQAVSHEALLQQIKPFSPAVEEFRNAFFELRQPRRDEAMMQKMEEEEIEREAQFMALKRPLDNAFLQQMSQQSQAIVDVNLGDFI